MLQKAWPWLLILVCVAAGLYLRSTPRLLPLSNQMAAVEILNADGAAATKRALDLYPKSTDSFRTKMARQMFDDHHRANRTDINRRIFQRASELKDRYRDEHGQVYLDGIDSYYWLRKLNSLLAYGRTGDRMIRGVAHDDTTGNPADVAPQRNIHLWLGYLLVKGVRLVAPGASTVGILFFLPLLLSALLTVFSFQTARRLGVNNLGAFAAAVAINLSPFLLSRTVNEWFDTDIYNVLFPLLIFGTFCGAFDPSVPRRRRVLLGAASSIGIACYASTWKGWWFIFDIMLVSALLFILNKIEVRRQTGADDPTIKDQGLALGIFALCSSLCVSVVGGFAIWKNFITEPLKLWHMMASPESLLWPNVYFTVAELGPVSAQQVINLLGGSLFFFGTLFVLVYIFLAEGGLRHPSYGFGFCCLVLWVGSTFYASLTAQRFVLLLVVPVGLGFGILVDRLYGAVVRLGARLGSPHYAAALRYGMVTLFALWLGGFVSADCRMLTGTFPQMNDKWYRTLTTIDKDTPKDAIINSWWDFGHWFTGVARRRALFDGMSQNTPYAYWTAQALVTDDEAYAARVLRMIDVNGNEAVETLKARAGTDVQQSVTLIKSALAKGGKDGLEMLRARMPARTADAVWAQIFPSAKPNAYFVVSSDMVDKIGPISYIGNWDFRKAALWHLKDRVPRTEAIDYLVRVANQKEEEAALTYAEATILRDTEARKWFSEVWGYFSPLSDATNWSDVVIFDNGLLWKPQEKAAYVSSDLPNLRGVPASVYFFEGGSLQEAEQKNATQLYSALLIKDKEKTRSLLLTSGLGKSLLVRLYYFRGEGLKHFTLWHQEVDENGKGIYVYKVNWPE